VLATDGIRLAMIDKNWFTSPADSGGIVSSRGFTGRKLPNASKHGANVEASASVSLSRSLVDIVVKLQRLSRSDFGPRVRIALLRSLAPQVHQVVGALSPAVVSSRQREPSARKGATLTECVLGPMQTNLKLALMALDRSSGAFAPGAAEDRRWLVAELSHSLGGQIEDCVRSDRPWVPGVWQELHDLQVYRARRLGVALDEDQGVGDTGDDQDVEYKRLLLLGLTKALLAPEQRSDRLFRSLHLWARESALREPDTYEGVFGLCVVEISKDAPPREVSGSIDVGFNGWVLEPASAFGDYVAGLARPQSWKGSPVDGT